MKSKMILLAIVATVSQSGWAGSLHPTGIEVQLYADAGPGIYYDQYFNRGDKLKKSYIYFPTVSAYEAYSKRLREESFKESDDGSTAKSYNESSEKTEN